MFTDYKATLYIFLASQQESLQQWWKTIQHVIHHFTFPIYCFLLCRPLLS